MPWLRLIFLFLVTAVLPTQLTFCFKRNYDAKYINSNIPEWKQRACEKTRNDKSNSHYFCDAKGDVKCLPGWQGDLCQVPMCRKGCDPMNGYCQRPGECRCRIGYTGEMCDKCIPLPGCQHGYCNKPFECICKTGWDGLFCTEPTCRQGCHSTRGYCEVPGECRCRIGWAGRNCSDCSVLPGCQFGTCTKPLECKCLPGYTGLLCSTAICADNCNKRHGYCQNPGECRCKVGWTGEHCDKCYPYPGCVNGDCERPWDCNCKPGWGGMLCDEKLTFCTDNPNVCENGGSCISITQHDGSFRCRCKRGYLGKNCEILDEFLLTSTAEPGITPPPLPIHLDDSEEVLIAQSIFLLPAGVTQRPTRTTTTAAVISASINNTMPTSVPTIPALNNTLSTTTMEAVTIEIENKTSHALDNEAHNTSEEQQVFSLNSTTTIPTTIASLQSSANSIIPQTVANENFGNSTKHINQKAKQQNVSDQWKDTLNAATTAKTPTTIIKVFHTKAPTTLYDESQISKEEYDEEDDDDENDESSEDEDDELLPNIFENET